MTRAVPALDSNEAREGTWLLELEGVTRFYGTVIGANDLNLRLPRGAYGLVGPNGAGKTTFIDLITGVLRPTLGRVRVFGGNPVVRARVLARIGLCPARDVLLPTVSAWLWVKHLLQVIGFAPAEAAARAADSLHRVGLQPVMHRPMGTYSLGMRQRAKVAQAIAHEPELLILDEPFNGLDPIGRHELTRLFREWAASGRSVILASHVLHEVEAVTDAFLLIYGGRLLASGSAGELRSLLVDLPQDVTIEGTNLDRLAARLVEIRGIQSLRLEQDHRRLYVSVREPLLLFQRLMHIISEEQLQVVRISGAEGDLGALFKVLTSRHQGQH